jgi:hypothetical protein
MNTKHQMSSTPLYHVWDAMIQRCYNKNSPAYFNYGGRGIRVSRSWQSFGAFYADMGDRPEGMTLDRINNNRGYSKRNCRWASRVEQARNKSNNRYITARGQTKLLVEWAEELGVPASTLWSRVHRSWDEEDVVCYPFRGRQTESTASKR